MTTGHFRNVDRPQAILAAFIKDGYDADHAKTLTAFVLKEGPSSHPTPKSVATMADIIDSYTAMLRDERLEHGSHERIAVYIAVPKARELLENGDSSAAAETMKPVFAAFEADRGSSGVIESQG